MREKIKYTQEARHSSLYNAIEQGHLFMVMLLSQTDIDFTATNEEGHTFLDYANLMYEVHTNLNRLEVVEYLK